MKNRKTATQFFKDAELIFKDELSYHDERVKNFSEEWNIPIGNFFDVNPVDRRQLNLAIKSEKLSDQALIFLAHNIIVWRRKKRFKKFMRRVCIWGSEDAVDDAVVMGFIDKETRDIFLELREMYCEAFEQEVLAREVDDHESGNTWGIGRRMIFRKIRRLAYQLIK